MPALIRSACGTCMVPVCPEQLGGLSTPRPPATISGGDGRDVLSGRALLRNDRGEDVTEAFLRGAREALSIARACGVKMALLKDQSPSCGCLTRYCDRPGGGMGVTAALLEAEGFHLFEIQPGGAFPPPGLEIDRGRLVPEAVCEKPEQQTGA